MERKRTFTVNNEPYFNPTRSPKRLGREARSNSDANVADCAVVVAAPDSPANHGAYIQINSAHSPKGRIHRTTLRGAEDPSPPSPWRGAATKRRASDTEYHGITPLTPRRKRVIELKGALANSVLNQLRTAWAGAWFALQVDHAWEQKRLQQYLTQRMRAGRGRGPRQSKQNRALTHPQVTSAFSRHSSLDECISRPKGLSDPLLSGRGKPLYSSTGSEISAQEVSKGSETLKVKPPYDPRLGSAGFIFVLVRA
jgi:hypothetical protein